MATAGGAGVIDWAAAVRSGRRLAPTGPDVTAAQAHEVVADLREFSARAELLVRDTTGLGSGLPIADAEVVDRRRWIEATAEGMALLTEPLAQKLAAGLPAAAKGRAAAGSQLGVVLGYLSGRVLGQYDPLIPDGAGGSGRLLLVAPNIVKVEREISERAPEPIPPAEFRLWVCLHESTHRLQFTAAPWLREHFRSLVGEFAEHSDANVSEVLKRAARAISGGGSFIEAVQTPAQLEVFDRLMALMTLLEGHAEHVMDAVGPAVVPSVSAIRTVFSERRRKGRGPIDRLIRAVLGMDMKIAQYVKGAAFVSAVVDMVGMAAFNAVWESSDTLPTRDEIAEPAAWVRRVLPGGA